MAIRHTKILLFSVSKVYHLGMQEISIFKEALLELESESVFKCLNSFSEI